MNHLLKILFLVPLFMSCITSQEDVPMKEEEQSTIGFNAKVQNSRAIATLTDVQNGFGVWAFITNSVRTNYPYMENTLVEDRNRDGEWDYGDPKYWLVDTEFSFVATYPYGNIYTLPTVDGQQTGDVQLTLETPSDTDYLVALSSVNTSDTVFNPSASVDLQFRHLLSNVSLNVWRDGAKHQNDQMRVRKVTLSNICKTGTYSSVTDTWSTTDEKLTMEYINDKVSDSDNIGAAIKTENSLNLGGIPSTPFSGVMLLPQPIDVSSNIVSLRIDYELKRQNAADWERAELETILPAITWEKGKQYVYNVVLSSVTDITIYYIHTKVDPWGTPQVGGTVIIK